MVSMSKRLKELRDAKGVGPMELASALGLPGKSIEKFESGRLTPTKEQQEKFRNFMKENFKKHDKHKGPQPPKAPIGPDEQMMPPPPMGNEHHGKMPPPPMNDGHRGHNPPPQR